MLERGRWLNLNGTWQYAVRPADRTALTDQPVPDDFDGEIRVPFAIETPASGVRRTLRPDQTLFYRRRIRLPEEWAGQRVRLNFEAVDHACAIWVDGILLGHHAGGYLPFGVELPTGRPDPEIVVAVRDPSDTGHQPRGKQALEPGNIWYTATSGIWGTVWAEPLPENAITQVHARPLEDLRGFRCRVDTERATRVAVRTALPDGTAITVDAPAGQDFDLALPDPHLWSPQDPYLYRLQVTTPDDEVTTWAGLRRVEIGPIPGARPGQRPAVLLNGAPIFLNIPLDQGYWPESGLTPPADEALVFDLTKLRELGFNGVRKHIKIESRRFYHHADRLGMLVMQDFVNGGRPGVTIGESRLVMALDLHRGDRSRLAMARAGRADRSNRAGYEGFIAQTIEHLAGQPSVVCWVLFNEAWGQYQTGRIERLVRELDPTRLVDAASGWYDQGGGDFRSRHRYVLKLRRPPRRDRRPFLLSEFGGLNLAVPGHLWPGTTQYGYRFHDSPAELATALARLYRKQLIPLVEHGLRGAVYTQVSDVEIETNGLFSYDRQVLKVDPAAMRTLNEELLAAFARLGG